jgi:YggT family protein
VDYFVRVVIIICDVMAIAIVIRSLLSWFPIDHDNVLVGFLVTITDPILSPLRRIVPKLDMIDLSPMIAIILLIIIASLLQRYAS